MSRKISEKDIKLLYGLSAGQCNICKTQVFKPFQNGNGYSHIGEMAHNIPFGNGKNAPRSEYKTIKSLGTDNTYENLILLCANCHTEVDSDTSHYTVEHLHQIKINHENEVREAINKNSGKDFYTVKTMHEYCNLQYIYAELRTASYKSIPHDITDIGNIHYFYLKPNEPTLYPFYDNNLNNLWDKIINNYNLIYQLTCSKFIMDNSPYLKLLGDNRLSLQEIENIENELKQLAEACKEWLNYCRQTNML